MIQECARIVKRYKGNLSFRLAWVCFASGNVKCYKNHSYEVRCFQRHLVEPLLVVK